MPKKAPRTALKTARWPCPKCGRQFTRVNQPHVCASRGKAKEPEHDVTRGRPQAVVQTYAALLQLVQSLGPIEVFARERYVLLRSVRIFADLVIMADAVRVAIHVARPLEDPIFFKVVSDRKQVTHVCKLQAPSQVWALEDYLREAYAFSLRE